MQKICSMPGCQRETLAKTLCAAHYKKLYRWGDPLANKRRPHIASRKTYLCWWAMVDRCHNKESDSYHYYGARGIKVCERWLVFKNFVEDMGEVPDGLSIDRMDNNGDYCASNVRWATPTEQMRNRRSVVLSVPTVKLIKKMKSEGARNCEISRTLSVAKRNVEAIVSGRTWREV